MGRGPPEARRGHQSPCEPPVLMWVPGKELGSSVGVAGALNLEPSTTPDCCLSDLQTGSHTGCALWGLASFTYRWIVTVIHVMCCDNVCIFNDDSIL